MTYVDIEVRGIDVKTVGGLLEVEVGYSVVANVRVLDKTEGSIWDRSLDQVGSNVLRTSTLRKCVDVRISHNFGNVLVGSSMLHAVRVQVDSAASKCAAALP